MFLFDTPGPGHGIGMRLSVWCSEEWPFSDPAVIAAESDQYPEVQGLSPAVFRASVCEAWNVSRADESENEAVRSEVPVLLISGGYDAETPAAWASKMQENLPNSVHLIFPGWTHGPTTNWDNPCAMEAANQFFNDPYSHPHPECLEKLGPLTFRTD